MKMTKKLLTLLLCVVMVASVFVATVAAAGGEANVTLTVSATEVNVGDSVTVKLGVVGMKASSVAFGLEFDTELLEATGITAKANAKLSYTYYDDIEEMDMTAELPATSISTKEEANNSGIVGVVWANDTEVDYGAKDVVTIKFKALKAGVVEFKLFEDSDGADGFKGEWTHGTTVTITDPAPACEHEYFYACDAHCMKCYELTNPEATHSMKRVEAVAATCTENGNIEYWTCEHCGGCWDNENATGMPLNKMMVVVPAAHTYDDNCDFDCNVCGEFRDAPHNLGDKIEAKVPANCLETGYDEHWICADCGGYFGDEEASWQLNPAWMYYTGDHVRPADAPDCAVVPCTLCGEDSYGEGTCDRGDVPACKDATCIKCGGEIYGEGHSYGYDEEWNPLKPFCQPGKCIYCGEELEKIYDCENGSYAPCSVDGECVYGCGKQFPATGEHDIDPCVGGMCWMCCEEFEPAHVYMYACDTHCMNCGEKTNPDAAHTIKHQDAVAPGSCIEFGNKEYWYCESCGGAWLDEALTQLTNLKSVKVAGECVSNSALCQDGICKNCGLPCPAEADHEYFYACDAHCMNCYELTNPEAAHSIKYVAAKEANCYENGNIEYWYCEHCNVCWDNENATGMPLNKMTVIIPSAGHDVEHVAAKEATCAEAGNIEYWYCKTCGDAWLDEAQTLNTNVKAVIRLVDHTIEHVEALDPTCLDDGNIEYWYCTVCGGAWLDEACRLNTNLKSVILPATEHDIEHVAAKDPTCLDDGNIEYWYCKKCGFAWLDEACTKNTNLKAVILPHTDHDIEHVAAKEATCAEAGNIEYWYCKKCGFAWLDEALTQNTNLKAVVRLADHTIEHVAAKDPTCLDMGNLEYWYCTVCGGAWLDEACLKNTNLKAVVLPQTDHDIEHVAAKDPTATENGNIEYWYCKNCGFAWLDEACTKNTNLKAVILPATGENDNPGTGDSAVFYAVAIVAVATVGAAVITFKKKREN